MASRAQTRTTAPPQHPRARQTSPGPRSEQHHESFAPFILRPVATALLMVAMFLAGGVAYFQLPVSALPEVDYPTIQVLTFYPGRQSRVVASAVTAPLERQFGEVAGLSQMTSTSAGGVSVIVMQFQLSLDIDVAEQEVQAAINAAQSYLPANLPTPPVYSKSNPADAPVLTLALTSNEMPLSQVEDLADTRLAPKISQISGRGAGEHFRRAEARRAHSGESHCAWRPTESIWKICATRSPATASTPPRATSTGRRRITPSTPTISC